MNLVACPSCSKQLQYTPQQAGMQVRCPSCQTEMILPGAPSPAPPANQPLQPSPVSPQQVPASGQQADPQGGQQFGQLPPANQQAFPQTPAAYPQNYPANPQTKQAHSKEKGVNPVVLWGSIGGGVLIVVIVVLVIVLNSGGGSERTAKNSGDSASGPNDQESTSTSGSPKELFYKFRDAMLSENHIVSQYDLSAREGRQSLEKMADQMASDYLEFSELRNLDGRAKVQKYFELTEKLAKVFAFKLTPERREALQNAEIVKVDIFDNGRMANVIVKTTDFLPQPTVYVKEDGNWRIKHTGTFWMAGQPPMTSYGLKPFPIPDFLVEVEPSKAESSLRSVSPGSGSVYAYECEGKTVKEVSDWFIETAPKLGWNIIDGQSLRTRKTDFEKCEQTGFDKPTDGGKNKFGIVFNPSQNGKLRVIVVFTGPYNGR